MTTPTSLHDRLAELAADAPPGGPEPGLWARGRRLQRRRAGTAVVVAVVVLALGAIGTLDWVTSRPSLAPADTEPVPGSLRLPDHFYEPPHRLPGTDGHPIGPLVAVLGGDRARHDGNGLAGVSGVTGEYRYLDLPDFVSTGDVYLSPDGASLAYWYGDPATDDAYDARIDGLAVYDTVTGDVVRHPVESRHGINAQGATWVGDRIWFGYLSYTDAERGTSGGLDQVVLDPDTQEYVGKSDAPMPWFAASYGAGGVLAEATGRSYRLWSADKLAVSNRFRVDRSVDGPAWTSLTADRSIVMADPDGQGASDSGRAAAVLLLDTVDPTHAATTPIPGVKALQVLGWRDDQHVVVLDRDGSFSSVDVATGAREPLTDVDRSADRAPRLQVATYAWSAPTFAAPAPQDPMSPLVVGGGAALVVVLGAGGLVVWRRRVRG